MNENLEYNFTLNQINANNKIRTILVHHISTLTNVIQQSKQWLSELDEQDRQLGERLEAIAGEDSKTIIEYSI